MISSLFTFINKNIYINYFRPTNVKRFKLNPTNLEKQNAKLATKLFSNTNSAALSRAGSLGAVEK